MHTFLRLTGIDSHDSVAKQSRNRLIVFQTFPFLGYVFQFAFVWIEEDEATIGVVFADDLLSPVVLAVVFWNVEDFLAVLKVAFPRVLHFRTLLLNWLFLSAPAVKIVLDKTSAIFTLRFLLQIFQIYLLATLHKLLFEILIFLHQFFHYFLRKSFSFCGRRALLVWIGLRSTRLQNELFFLRKEKFQFWSFPAFESNSVRLPSSSAEPTPQILSTSAEGQHTHCLFCSSHCGAFK